MSRSLEILENPSMKTLKWKNRKEEVQKDERGKALKNADGSIIKKVVRDTGWYYWDKSGNDGEGCEVHVPMPITFAWLETASSLSGYNKDRETGVYSNEVLDLKKHTMTVKVGKDTIAEGFYADIKADAKEAGAKFCNAVYGLVNVDGEYEIWRFLMVGSSFSSWVNFSNNIKNKTKSITIYDSKERETPNGDIYEEPVFKYLELPNGMGEEADKVAVEVVDPYFKYILDKPKGVLETGYND
jgi:hypothetical protein